MDPAGIHGRVLPRQTQLGRETVLRRSSTWIFDGRRNEKDPRELITGYKLYQRFEKPQYLHPLNCNGYLVTEFDVLFGDAERIPDMNPSP